jgi:hypothetical protein
MAFDETLYDDCATGGYPKLYMMIVPLEDTPNSYNIISYNKREQYNGHIELCDKSNSGGDCSVQ